MRRRRCARAAGIALVGLVLIALIAGCRPPGAAPPTAVQGGPVETVPTGPRPTPFASTYFGCPAEGSGGDPQLNFLKNRVDTADWQPLTVGAILDLKWPKKTENRHMGEWSAADRAEIDVHNGVPVQVEGYLLGVRAEGPESPNCYSKEEIDFHIWLAAQPDNDRGMKSVVVEVTPRVRALHGNWRVGDIQRLVRDKSRVRISGWLFFDPEHPDQVGKSRGTIWEIHPIMKIEVAEQGGTWRALP